MRECAERVRSPSYTPIDWRVMKNRYRIILKSGASFKIKAEDIEVTWDTIKDNPIVTRYHAEGITNWFMVIPSDISAVVKL